MEKLAGHWLGRLWRWASSTVGKALRTPRRRRIRMTRLSHSCRPSGTSTGTAVCRDRDLIGCDLQTTEGNERFKRENLITECRKFVAFTAGEAFKVMSE